MEEKYAIPQSIPLCSACDELIQSNLDDYRELKRDNELIQWSNSL
jgi:hypothetical protein